MLFRSGEITLRHLENGIADEREYFLHSLDVVEKISLKKELHVKFVFDEFQDILRISDDFILEQMRATIQHHEAVAYVFLGSIESIMTKIFSSKASPFFHFAKIMSLSGLDIDELYEYTQNVFNAQKIEFDESLLKLLQFLQGHPDYSAQVLQTLYFRAIIEKAKIDQKFCLDVLTDTVLENRAYLEELISKAKQKKHHFELLHALANGYKVELSSKSLYSVHVSLEELGLIKNVGRGEYVINDIFLQILLRQKDEGLLVRIE